MEILDTAQHLSPEQTSTLRIQASSNTLKSIKVQLHKVSANWVIGQEPPTLQDISFTVEPGSICCLAGTVGSGRSSVLNVLLKELSLNNGSIVMTKNAKFEVDILKLGTGFYSDNQRVKISYSSQDAWLFTGSVKENILFGETFDLEKYSKVFTMKHLVLYFIK